MAYYKIEFVDKTGTQRVEYLQGIDEDDALADFPIPKYNISDISTDLFGQFRDIDLLKPKLKLFQQSLLLQTVAGIIASGETVRRAFDALLAKSKSIKYDEEQYSKCESLEDFIALLDFHPAVKSIAAVGDRTGNYVDALESAADFVSTLATNQEEFKGSVKQAYIYSFVAIFFIIVAPFVQGNMLYEMVYVDEAPLTLNFASHLLINAVDFYKGYWHISLAIIVLAIIKWDTIYEVVKNWPGMKSIHSLRCINRSIVFIAIFRMLLQAGVPPVKIIGLLYSNAKGRDRLIYRDMHDLVTGGEEVVNTLIEEEWPEIMGFTLKDVDKKEPKTLNKTLLSARNTLSMSQKEAGKGIGSFASMLSMGIIFFVITVIFMGFYIPILSMQGMQ